MGNLRFTLEDCARAQRAVRRAAAAENVDLDAAWSEAEQELKAMGIAIGGDEGSGLPAGHCSDDFGRVRKIVAPKPRTPELEIKPRVRCIEHQEKTWAASSGNFYACCPVDGCRWGQLTEKGRPIKKHSDAADHSLDELFNDIPQVEPTDDFEGVIEVAELGVTPEHVPAGQDEPEDGELDGEPDVVFDEEESDESIED